MNNEQIKKFSVIGIAVRTTNENDQAGKDIPALWDKFIADGIAEKIPNKTSDSIYCIYTEYEKDHTKPYTTIIGCKVENTSIVPIGMVGKTFDEANYAKRVVKGNLLQGIVFNEWVKIWNADLKRTYTADFEVYGERAQNPQNAAVDIFIAIK